MRPMTQILLIDNGSKRANATLQLRAIAKQVSALIGQEVVPVSLQHADAIAAEQLDSQPANTLPEYLCQQAGQGELRFELLPLFFGPSRALGSFVPQTVEQIQPDFADLQVVLAQPLCPLPEGEPQLAQLLWQQIESRLQILPEAQIVLVDHGSPIPRVTAVREYLAQQLREQSARAIAEAVMERREGPEYDFNGPLLEHWLRQQAEQGARQVIVSMLFLLPGRHAGAGGDVVQICQAVQQDFPQLQIEITPLVGEHPGLAAILKQRWLDLHR